MPPATHGSYSEFWEKTVPDTGNGPGSACQGHPKHKILLDWLEVSLIHGRTDLSQYMVPAYVAHATQRKVVGPNIYRTQTSRSSELKMDFRLVKTFCVLDIAMT